MVRATGYQLFPIRAELSSTTLCSTYLYTCSQLAPRLTPSASRSQTMFICKACAQRASTSLLRRLPVADIRLGLPSRSFATQRRNRSTSEPQNLSSDWGILDDVPVRREERNDNLKDFEKQKALEKMKRATRIELRLTTDPYHIADNVLHKLENDEFEKALMLVQEASKNKQVVVSWNHLIAYEFMNQRLHSALKLYNEVSCCPECPQAIANMTMMTS